ncbi:MAG TPA: dephospho-CoA kinase [Terriglobales bacterium]|nr:dephospho-CoA kinase [Terriglobales bacterium]
MLRVGLTGGLGCGKSTVAAMMAARGAHVIDADRVARGLMTPGQDVYDAVVRHFGPDVVQPDGAIDRAKLAKLVFGGGRVAELNRLVHPAVIAYQQEWMQRIEESEPQAIAVVEAALILEAGVNGRFDKLIVVTCTPEQKVERYAKRVSAQGMDEAAARAEAERRIAAQMPDEKKIKVADFVIDNSGPLSGTQQQVDAAMDELERLAAASRV